MLLGIDCGTSSLKALLLSPDGELAAGPVRVPLEVSTPHPGWAEMDPEDWWEAFVSACRLLRGHNPDAYHAIRGVGISTIFPALTLMDGEGAPLRPSILYCDLRSVRETRFIEKEFGRERFEAITGNRLTPGTCMLPGILWLRKHEPDALDRARGIGSAASFFVRRLTGRLVLDYSNASFSGLTAAGREDRYDPDLLELAGISPDILPPLVPSIEPVGRLTAEAAQTLGLAGDAVVAAGGGDAIMAAVGAGIVESGRLLVCTGSTDCPMVILDRPPGHPVFANCRYPLPHLWASIAATSTAGASVKWCCENVFHCTTEDLTRWAGQAPPGAGGVVFLPYLQGERTPWWDPYARGVFFGLGTDTGRNEMARAVFEGVAHAWRQIFAHLRECYGIKQTAEVAVVGGSTGNALWNAIRASIIGRPLRVLRFAESASLGAAMCGGLAAGVFASPEEASRRTDNLRDSFVVRPEPDWSEATADGARVYDSLYPALKNLFAERKNPE